MDRKQTVCERNMCTGCMACAAVCTHNAITIEEDIQSYNAWIDYEKCINCSACKRVCQQIYLLDMVTPKEWYQGWAKDTKIRKKASSGGIAFQITLSFIQQGGVVCSCLFREGKFIFEICDTEQEADKFIGSKYVKSNPLKAYEIIKKELQANKKVLFIGLPCQSAGIQKFIDDKLRLNLYTIDLVCHGTPSPRLLDKYLEQYELSLSKIETIEFRKKSRFQLRNNQTFIESNGTCDMYSIAFLNAISYTENCYHCYYAKLDRVSDLTIGDSWGTKMSQEEQKKGISLILCQSDKGKELLRLSNLHLEKVDINRAILHNHQLSYPCMRPMKREKFFNILDGKGFNQAVWRCYPKKCIKQVVKSALMKIYEGGG